MNIRVPQLFRRRVASRSGVTLVEGMIAAAVLTIGILGIFGLMRGLSHESFYSVRNAMASDVARHRLELLMDADYSSLASGSRQVGMFNTSWVVGAATNRIKSIRVDVSYNGPSGRQRTVTMHSFSYDPTPSTSSINFTNFPTGVIFP